MDQEMLDMFNLVINKIDGLDKRMDGFDNWMDGFDNRMDGFDKKLAETESRIMVYIENNIGKRLDALSDGYKLNYEQNDITETKVDVVSDRVDALEDRVTVLEHAG